MSGSNRLVVSKSILEGASESTLSKNLLNANEVAAEESDETKKEEESE